MNKLIEAFVLNLMSYLILAVCAVFAFVPPIILAIVCGSEWWMLTVLITLPVVRTVIDAIDNKLKKNKRGAEVQGDD